MIHFEPDATREINFDGLVGPTHNYSGLAHGNIASASHRGLVSNPREAALQGLAKMKALHDAGFAQGVLPPQPRPAIEMLDRLGFTGTPSQKLAAAWAADPAIVRAISSAAAMWTANAATITPSPDAADGRVHFTAANLQSSFHRAIEAPTTAAALGAIFADESCFVHHQALPATPAFSDEGAANHTRLCSTYDAPGVHLFVYGREGLDRGHAKPTGSKRFTARQTLEASQAVARQHGLKAVQCVFARQSATAIDAGVFHNDVIAVGNGPVLLYHETAFADEDTVLAELREKMGARGARLIPVRVASEAVSLADAVATYLFNSQLLTRADGSMVVIVPAECERNPAVAAELGRIVADPANPIAEYRAYDVKQSMDNGGGPACLRLRVVLTAAERAAMNPGVLFDDALHDKLGAWVERHYRDRLAVDDLADPALIDETQTALDELTRLLKLGSIYAFQSAG
ncbi:N-succinylarginine dihydrolase [Salinisphaera hydrothermalis]|uniref:N-succinylarginine dihydrolase n=1 Tax=Salinisphaera hydrothermalis (strain C41B8) TaxID=1304275 RepID=A0A084IL82_SALHC|nr:N-succinylarginine dihydrolase [Salinisphaera hydrothermalis]KEZ77466.1 succinylarginine dihydrolase [Salinisphaera hydrothermalis C41B8]